MLRLVSCLISITLVFSVPLNDKMARPIPGYPSSYNTDIYSGYLSVRNSSRQIHYVFVESVNGANNKDPITLWLNGGPGCSSLLGFIQQIGPYYLQDGVDYKQGDMLKQNKYSWHKRSNLLFLQSPSGVGYSYNLDKNYIYNDANTAHDNLYALIDFFSDNKFKQYRTNKLFIAGQSYAGKYIPDLAKLIDQYNYIQEGPAINLVSILIGNGVMTFETLLESTYEYMINRKFVDPEIVPYYQSSCQSDPQSAGYVYGYCFYNDSFDQQSNKKLYSSQQGILMKIKQHFKSNNPESNHRYNGAPCAFFDGVHDYFNLNQKAFKAKWDLQQWNGPCAENITYRIDPAGSMHSYRYLLGLSTTSRKISIILYNGNWDAVVPYVDTLKGIQLLNLQEANTYNPWFTDRQHSGFQQIYSGVIFITVKGGSHQVPQSKRAEAYNMFDSIIQGHTDGSIFQKGVFWRQR